MDNSIIDRFYLEYVTSNGEPRCCFARSFSIVDGELSIVSAAGREIPKVEIRSIRINKIER